jgi:hypothetical protein
VAGKTAGDALPIALGFGALTVGGLRWSEGDHAQTFEAAAESLALTAGVTEILKNTVGRNRPDRSSSMSFISGHTSVAFGATTVLIREFEDRDDPSWSPMELLYYAPAVYVGWERVRADRHWASDVVAGAFVGVFVSNWVWDAHFGDAEHRDTIFVEPSKVSWHLMSGEIDGHPTLGLEISF